MALTPYTNTYTDVDGTIIDADDVVNEFDRMAEFLNAWIDSFNLIEDTTVTTIDLDGEDSVEISPANGLFQKIIVPGDVTQLDVDFLARPAVTTYRVYLTLRFQSPTTTFRVFSPNDGNTFRRFQLVHTPSQVIANDYYTAVVLATYSSTGSMIKVFADNQEATAITADDLLGAAPS